MKNEVLSFRVDKKTKSKLMALVCKEEMSISDLCSLSLDNFLNNDTLNRINDIKNKHIEEVKQLKKEQNTEIEKLKKEISDKDYTISKLEDVLKIYIGKK